MPSKWYKKGLNKEYKVRDQLYDNGFDIAQRSAGSKSPIDLFAIKRNTRTIKFIQCKSASFKDSQRKKLLSEFSWLNNVFRVEFEVIQLRIHRNNKFSLNLLYSHNHNPFQ